MSKYIILILTTLFFSKAAIAQNALKHVRCELNATRGLIQNNKICDSIEESASFFRCNIDMWETFGKSTCSNIGRSSASNQIFISNRQLSNFEDFKIGRLSSELMTNQRKQLFQMSREEFIRMDKFTEQEMDDLEQAQARSRSYNFLDQSIKLLGGGKSGGRLQLRLYDIYIERTHDYLHQHGSRGELQLNKHHY
jgi:hypothetical protein